jgi:hypothetical protein
MAWRQTTDKSTGTANGTGNGGYLCLESCYFTPHLRKCWLRGDSASKAEISALKNVRCNGVLCLKA